MSRLGFTEAGLKLAVATIIGVMLVALAAGVLQAAWSYEVGRGIIICLAVAVVLWRIMSTVERYL